MIQNHIEGGGKWDGSRYQEICLYFRTKMTTCMEKVSKAIYCSEQNSSIELFRML